MCRLELLKGADKHFFSALPSQAAPSRLKKNVCHLRKKPFSRSCDTLIMKSPIRSYWLMMSM